MTANVGKSSVVRGVVRRCTWPYRVYACARDLTGPGSYASQTHAQAEKEEETFFASEPSLSASASRCGIAFLTSKIVKVLHKRIEEEVRSSGLLSSPLHAAPPADVV